MRPRRRRGGAGPTRARCAGSSSAKAISPEWKAAAPETVRAYDRRFDYLNRNFGTAEFSSFTEADVRAIRNKLRATPSIADGVVQMIGRLWRFAKEDLE